MHTHSIASVLPKYRRYSVRIADTVSRYFFRYRVPSIGDTFFPDKSVHLVPILFSLQSTVAVDGALKKFVPWYSLTERYLQTMLRSLFSDHPSVQKIFILKLLYQSTEYRYRVPSIDWAKYRVSSTEYRWTNPVFVTSTGGTIKKYRAMLCFLLATVSTKFEKQKDERYN